MRLNKVDKQLPSAQVNVTLPGKLKAELDGYAAYYQHNTARPSASAESSSRSFATSSSPTASSSRGSSAIPAALQTGTAAPPIRKCDEVLHVHRYWMWREVR